MAKIDINTYIKKAKLIVRQIIISVLALLFLSTAVPITLAVFGPTCIIRWIIYNIAKRFKPNLGKMLTAYSSMHYLHTNGSIIAVFVLEGIPLIDKIRKDLEENILHVKIPQTKEDLYPELQQNITTWMGFYFWKPIKEFKVEDHVSLRDTKERINLDGDIGRNIIKEFGRKPWSKNRSLFEAVILPNVQTNSCSDSNTNHFALLARWHHCLADGISFLKLIANVCDPPPITSFPVETNSVLNIKATTMWTHFLKLIAILTTIVSASYDFVESIVVRKGSKDPFKLEEKAVHYSSSYYASNLIPFNDFKILAKRNDVKFNGGMLGALAGTFRRFSKNDLQDDVVLDVVLPLPNHPSKLRNHATNGFIKLPVTVKSPSKCLELTQQSFEKLRRSLTPLVFTKLNLLVGCQFPSLLKLFVPVAVNHPTVILINFLWATTPETIVGYPFKDFYFHVGAVSGSKFLVMIFLSYAGTSKLMVQSDIGIFSQEELENFIECFAQEVKFLKDGPRLETV